MYALRPITNEAEHEEALEALAELWNAQPGSAEAATLDALATLIEAYEVTHYPLETPDPIELIAYHMEQNGLTRADLGDLLGSRPRATEVLGRKRSLSVEMIRKLVDVWHLPAETLIRPTRRKPARRSPRRGKHRSARAASRTARGG